MNCDRIYPFDDCDYCHHEHCDKQFVMIKSTLFSLDTRLQTEVTKREEDDTQLSERIDELEKSSSAKHDELENKLNAEITRATNSESQLNIDIQNEKQRAETAEDALTKQIENVESQLNTSINNEVERAKAAETNLQNGIDEVKEDLATSVNDLTEKITTEEGRAKQAEIDLDNSIKAEATERLQADEVINQTIANIQKQVTANTTELAKTKWTQMVIDLQ